MEEFLIQAAAIGVITLTITKGSVFRTLRGKAKGRFKALLCCPYCFAHWVSFAGTGIWYNPELGFIAQAFGYVAISSFVMIPLSWWIRWLDRTHTA